MGKECSGLKKDLKINTREGTSIRHLRIGNKFCLKMTPLNFWIKLTQKGHYQTLKNENTIKFYTFKLI